jgi:hypothetical protein
MEAVSPARQDFQHSAKVLKINQLADPALAGLIAPSIKVLFMDGH